MAWGVAQENTCKEFKGHDLKKNNNNEGGKQGWTHLKILIGNYKVKGQDLITQMESSTPIIICHPMICVYLTDCISIFK